MGYSAAAYPGAGTGPVWSQTATGPAAAERYLLDTAQRSELGGSAGPLPALPELPPPLSGTEPERSL